jgi:hypothetical protein
MMAMSVYLRTAAYIGLSIVVPVAMTVTACLLDHFVRVKPRVKRADELRRQHENSTEGVKDEEKDKTRPNISIQGFSAKKMDDLESQGVSCL